MNCCAGIEKQQQTVTFKVLHIYNCRLFARLDFSRWKIPSLVVMVSILFSQVYKASAVEIIYNSASFEYTGDYQTFVVPELVYSITVTAYGASGETSGAPGGNGGMIQGKLSLSIFYIWVMWGIY